MCVCVAALLCPFLLFYIFHTGTQGHIAADLFLFAKRFFPHSTTYHHRSASGLCPGLIGLVSLTPNILFWRGHFSCEKQQNKSGESNNSTISTTQYNYKNLCVCEPNESKWLTSSTSSTKEKEKAAITSEWVSVVFVCICVCVFFWCSFFFFFTYLLLLTLYSGSPQKDHGAAATEQDWSDIQLAETSESHRPASLDVSFDAIAAKPTFLTWLTLGRINLGPARAVRAMTEILIFLLSRVRVNWVIYRKKRGYSFCYW